ncbi:MAG: Polyribonucleotide nucleotidyltransferase [candidate division TM6 bacterium GW2011_GWF2_32_72]|nr:MAG: Polyribonucleotide nucleotidyltransferase [candidate division TM6 bacterium GW2011_GWF2_32_72]
MAKIFKLEEFGYEVEIGKFAGQADGAVMFKNGGTYLLSTVVAEPTKDFPGFFPLSVDYREQFAAAGRIPGGYFKREGKPSDLEVLTSRLIDRALRPLFPEDYFNSVQVLNTLYSFDKVHNPNSIVLMAASLALSISKVPFMGPVGVVEIGRVDGKLVLDPNSTDREKSDVKIVVAGTDEGINMVEGSCDQISEKEFLDILFLAHEKIKKQVVWQKEIQKELGIVKDPVKNSFDWNLWKERAFKFLTEEKVQTVYVDDKVIRAERLAKLKEDFNELHRGEIEAEEGLFQVVDYIFEQALKVQMTDMIISSGKRTDGRSYDQVRKIDVEVGLLPFTHGSALFKRGRTQALVTTTLGGGQDALKQDDLMSVKPVEKKFMLHYNFPPFSVGEARAVRGVGRREVGHGYLAESSFKYVLPAESDFPYVIRVVSDILESDGSSSMATVCGTTMSLMDAGVPISNMVSGVAMGLLQSQSGKFQVLTDISGFEDNFGLMDFKVTGTEKGITAIQMDIKYKGGLPRDVFESALAQALAGRTHIMGEMKNVMDKPRAELSKFVPKVVVVKVNKDKIGAIIGPGGKNIKEIIEKTSTSIDIDDDGFVKIFGTPGELMDKAIVWVKVLGGELERGMKFSGKIKKIAEFGLFVELVPGQDGLVHISAIPKEQQKDMERFYKVGDVMDVIVEDYDKFSGRIKLKPNKS